MTNVVILSVVVWSVCGLLAAVIFDLYLNWKYPTVKQPVLSTLLSWIPVWFGPISLFAVIVYIVMKRKK